MPDPLLIAKNRDSRALPSACARQPPRPHHRRHRHRKDRHAAGDGRAFSAYRRSGVHGRRQGRPLGHHAARRPFAEALERLKLIGAPEPAYAACPAVFWDVFGEQGHPVRATVSDLGPLLLSRVLNLNETQAGVLALVFKVADDNGLLLLDLKDLRAMLQHVGRSCAGAADELRQRLRREHRRDPARAARARAAGRGAIHRRADAERGRPAPDGRRRPRRRQHPGRRQAPQRAEALFDAAAVAPFRALRASARSRRPRQAEARVLLRRGASPVHRCAEDRCSTRSSRSCASSARRASASTSSRRIRSTCRRRCWASSAIASSMRCARSRRATRRRSRPPPRRCAPIPKIDTEKAITELAVGEALVSFLDAKGRPGDGRARVRAAARGRIGPATPDERQRVIAAFRAGRCVRQAGRSRIRVRASQGSRAPAAPPAGAAPPAPRRKLDGFRQGFARRPSFRKRAQGQHRRSGGEERGANDRLDGRTRNRPRRAGIAARPVASAESPAVHCRARGRCARARTMRSPVAQPVDDRYRAARSPVHHRDNRQSLRGTDNCSEDGGTQFRRGMTLARFAKRARMPWISLPKAAATCKCKRPATHVQTAYATFR